MRWRVASAPERWYLRISLQRTEVQAGSVSQRWGGKLRWRQQVCTCTQKGTFADGKTPAELVQAVPASRGQT